MQHHRTTTLSVLCLTLLAFFGTTPLRAEFKKCRIQVSANETKQTRSEWDYAWALDTNWVEAGKKRTLDVTVNSNYIRGEERVKSDRLKTSTRLLGSDGRAWRPVLLVQTEGDHQARMLDTLVAAGGRYQLTGGYIELTAGMRKDLQTADGWSSDVGVEFAYEQALTKQLRCSLKPAVGYDVTGSVRLNEERVRYGVDLKLDYRLTDSVGLGYRLWTGNTAKNDRTQWLGVTYTLK